MTAAVIALAVLVLLLASGLAVMVLAYLGSLDHITELESLARSLARRVRHQQDRIDGYRAELDALSLSSPPPAAAAALAPDDPSLLPAEVEQWLRERNDR